jgi:hypothetical protein
VAGAAQSDQSVEIEIGAALGAPDDVMDIERAAPAAGFAGPPGAAPHFGADDLPLLARRALPSAGSRLIRSASPPRRALQWFLDSLMSSSQRSWSLRIRFVLLQRVRVLLRLVVYLLLAVFLFAVPLE